MQNDSRYTCNKILIVNRKKMVKITHHFSLKKKKRIQNITSNVGFEAFWRRANHHERLIIVEFWKNSSKKRRKSNWEKEQENTKARKERKGGWTSTRRRKKKEYREEKSILSKSKEACARATSPAANCNFVVRSL